ncbi:hypothetical protein [Halospeciosus flavus]|uniref:XapX domain-containing protein n=1 Tax=Halospeciosus flavus TaxID=3032283 RepID=A0ABD5Z5C0_9EURY|nr:hypothetical protein [Halospeciosus flavus]
MNLVLAAACFAAAGVFALAGRTASLPPPVARVGTLVSFTLGLFALLAK